MKYHRVNVIAISYRGYLNSEQNADVPSEIGLKTDAEAIGNYLQTKLVRNYSVYKCMVSRGYDQNKLFVMGRSLGGAVAIHFVNKF